MYHSIGKAASLAHNLCVSQAFVNITEEFAALFATHTVLTPNERLAREYHFAYDRYQREQGVGGWRTLRCYSLSRFLQSELRRAQDEYEIDAEPIRNHTFSSLIMQHAPASPAVLSQTFAKAWQTMHRYDIDIHAEEFNSARGKIFQSWMQRVKVALPDNALLEEKTGDALIQHKIHPQHGLLLMDFEQFTSVEKRYLEFAAQSIEVTQIKTPIRERADAKLHGFADLGEELAAASAWAYRVKTEDAQARIGIVVPDLAGHYQLVQRQCAAIFDPHRGSLSPSFDLSAGTSLYDQPVWRHAQQLLAALHTGLNPQITEFLGHSPFLDLSSLTQLAQKWPRQLPHTVTFRQLMPWLADTPLPEWLSGTPQATVKLSFSDWARAIMRTLEGAGWPAISSLNSIQYQATQAIEQMFEQFQADVGEVTTGKLDFGAALVLLDLCLQQKLFAPQRPHSDILILGLLETTGLRFSHLWICGMDENSFPGKSVASPFIPRAVAVRHGVPRCTQADELTFAQTQLHHWYHNCDELHFSHSQSSDDNEQNPSPLLDGMPLTPLTAPIHPYFVDPQQPRERYIDEQGSKVASAGLGGGTGLLRDQAACPFRAYAMHRLGLKRPQVATDFPNALIRGNLLHDALFDLVRRHSTQDLLLSLTPATITETCERAIRKFPAPLPEIFIQSEIARLTKLILEWLILEGERQPFEAVYLEETFALQLNHLQFKIRIDRIDRIDQQLVVIDYKTGKVSLSGVLKTPTRDPQLPAYSLIDEEIAGVYYAEVREQPRLIGVADDSGKIDGAKTTAIGHPWQDQRRLWRQELDLLAAAFADGHAPVQPQPGACNYCHLSSLCRIKDDQHDG